MSPGSGQVLAGARQAAIELPGDCYAVRTKRDKPEVESEIGRLIGKRGRSSQWRSRGTRARTSRYDRGGAIGAHEMMSKRSRVVLRQARNGAAAARNSRTRDERRHPIVKEVRADEIRSP